MCALIAARDLMSAAYVWKGAYVNMLHIGTGNADRYDVFRLACSRAGVATDTPGVIDHLGPPHRLRSRFFQHDVFIASANYITAQTLV
ncbi:MAG TPA: hypothetical protein VJT50_15620 [Pyrinomonadaceae bacterium]|nr:hypothetical protein [Pyrinomonadaceae bacterium]